MLYDDVVEEIADATYNVVAKAKEKKEAEGKKNILTWFLTKLEIMSLDKRGHMCF